MDFADSVRDRKPCGAALRWAGEGTRPYVSAYLFRRFLFDDDLQVRGHILVQLDRHGEFAHGLERFVDLNLAAVDVKALLGQRVRDVAGGD